MGKWDDDLYDRIIKTLDHFIPNFRARVPVDAEDAQQKKERREKLQEIVQTLTRRREINNNIQLSEAFGEWEEYIKQLIRPNIYAAIEIGRAHV